MRQVLPLLFVLALATGGLATLRPPAHPLFDSDTVHVIHLSFDQPDWWEQLTDNYESYEDPPYLAATFAWESSVLDSIGVRFKGNSSYSAEMGLKKSFKLDLNEFISGQELFGMDKLNLNNCFLDPSYVREKCAYEIAGTMGVPTMRTNYAALYINDEYWGLYLLVEQYDQEFIESRFGSGEEGNLWKGEPHGSMEYLGDTADLYYESYELKTNEEENDWSALVDLVDAINNTPTTSLRDTLHERVDINSAMAMLAFDNLLVNLDSYIGRCANYYFYHRDVDSRMVFSKWDLNEAWGVFNMNMSLIQLMHLPHHYANTQPRPLATQLWQVAGYDSLYMAHLRRLMGGAAHPDTVLPRMEELRELIRPWAISDPNSPFGADDFEAALDSDVVTGDPGHPGRVIPGLRNFITVRHNWLSTLIGTWTPPQGLVLNELMAGNASSFADEAGEYDDWIEILNASDSPISLSGLGLTDHLEGFDDYLFPDTVLAAGARLIVWADEDPEQGALHADFKLDADGEEVYLVQGAALVDYACFHSLGDNVAWGRWPDGGGEWQQMTQATPGAENDSSSAPASTILFLNEFLASNNNGLTDETGTAEDWAEIFNPGPAAVQMGGLYLTDDNDEPTQWMFPDTLLAAGGFLLVWCDDDTGDGPLHTTFKLSADGEAIALFGRLESGNELIDGRSFGPQQTDVSEGRRLDGLDEWVSFAEPTPGASNGGLLVEDLCIQVESAVIQLSWNESASGCSYRVYCSDSPYAAFPQGWILCADGLSETSWQTTAVADLRVYVVTALLP